MSRPEPQANLKTGVRATLDFSTSEPPLRLLPLQAKCSRIASPHPCRKVPKLWVLPPLWLVLPVPRHLDLPPTRDRDAERSFTSLSNGTAQTHESISTHSGKCTETQARVVYCTQTAGDNVNVQRTVHGLGSRHSPHASAATAFLKTRLRATLDFGTLSAPLSFL